MAASTEFTVNKTIIPGLLEIEVSLLEDNRGWFQEKFQKAKLVAAGFPSDFNPVQQNVSYNKEAGVVRGLHAEPWDKYTGVIKGKVFAAFVDLRKGGSFGRTVCLTMDQGKTVFVPNGVANSYQSLEPDTYYQYLVNAHWSKEAVYTSLNVADPGLNIPWPIPLDSSTVSEKDKNNPMLKDIKPI